MLGPFIQSFMLVGVIYFYSKSIISLINDYYKDEFKNQFRDDLKGVQNLKSESKDDIEADKENGVVINRKDVIPSPVIEGIPDIFNTPPERISVGINNEKLLSPKRSNSIEKLTDDNLIEEILTANVKEQKCKNPDIQQHHQQQRQKIKLIQFSTSSCESTKSQQSLDCTDPIKDDNNYYCRIDSKNFNNKKIISNQLPNNKIKLDYNRQEISSKQKNSPSTSEDDDLNILMPTIVMVSTKDCNKNDDDDDNNDMRKLLQSIKINNNDDQHPHNHFHYLQYNYHHERQLKNNRDGYENHLIHDNNNPSNKKNGDKDGGNHFDDEFIQKLENAAAKRRGDYEKINRIKKSKLFKSESSTSTTSSMSYENFILNDVNNVCMTRRKSVNEMIQYWNNQLNLNEENAKNEKKLSNGVEQNHHNHQSNHDLHFLNTNGDVRV